MVIQNAIIPRPGIVLLLACLLAWPPDLPAHEVAGGDSFMCEIQPPEEFDRADAGSPEAQYNVGNMLDYCRPEDNAAAARYFLRAARQGNIKSALRLGRNYMFGIGVPRDDREAYFWLGVGKRLFRAAAHPPRDLNPHLPYVESDLALLEKHLTPEEFSALRARIDGWKPAPEKPDASTPSR